MALILTQQRTQHAQASRTVSPHHAESRGPHSWGSQSGVGDKEQSVRILCSSFFLHCFKTVSRLTSGRLDLAASPGSWVHRLLWTAQRLSFCNTTRGKSKLQGDALPREYHKAKHQDVMSIKPTEGETKVKGRLLRECCKFTGQDVTRTELQDDRCGA